MKKLMAKLEDIMVAITFAESGEYDEAVKRSETVDSCQDGSIDSLPVMKQSVLQNAGK